MLKLIMKFRHEAPSLSKKSKKIQYAIKHVGHAVNQPREIFRALEEKVSKQQDAWQQMNLEGNSYGLTSKFIKRYGVNLQDDTFVVVFCEDGATLRSAKAFKYNLLEKLAVYSEDPEIVEDPLTTVGRQKTQR